MAVPSSDRLTPAQAREVWSLFSGSPLFARWPGAASAVAAVLEPAPIPPDSIIYRWDDGPEYLYLITRGKVEQTVRKSGQTWLRQVLGPGEFFGQIGLVSDKYQARAVAAPGTVLYRLSAANLGRLIDSNPTLREDLLHDRLAGRLRRVPLFRTLSDAQLRWLAQVTQERNIGQGSQLPLDAEPGLWIVDWGQVMVTGPANPHPENWDEWGITAGNFCIAPGAGLRWGDRCVAKTARTALASRLLYLPAAALDRLVEAFPDVGNLLARPLDITALLGAAGLLTELSPNQREHLAQFAAWEFVPAGRNVTTQGTTGHNYVLVRDGAVVLQAMDDRGRMRPTSRHVAVWSYGSSSLLEGKPRDATVRAVSAPDVTGQIVLEGADVLLLDRRDVQYAFARDPALWGRTASLVKDTTQVEEKKKEFAWMDADETVHWIKHPHIFWLIVPESIVVVLGVILLTVAGVAATSESIGVALGAGALAIPLAIVATIIAINYSDDYYALTNRRITRRDRQLFFYEARVEAPLDMVQDVTIDATFWGRLFNFGQVTVATASKRPPIFLTAVPEPEQVRIDILTGRTEAKAAGQAHQTEMLRSGLISGLQLALPVVGRTPALGPDAAPPQSLGRRIFGREAKPPTPSQEVLPGTPRPRPQWMTDLAQKLPGDWGTVLFGPEKPQPKASSGQIVMRKHPLNLVIRAGLPALLTVLVGALGVGLLVAQPELAGVSQAALCLPVLVVFVACAAWLAWEYVDYHNDIYVLTDEQIIDIEMKPLGIDTQRRQGGLERVQNVEAQQRGIWAVIFDYGDVVISTAAGDEGYTFTMVPHPKQVQALVFQKLDAFRRKQEEDNAQRRQRELIDSLRVYDQIRSDYPARNLGSD